VSSVEVQVGTCEDQRVRLVHFLASENDIDKQVRRKAAFIVVVAWKRTCKVSHKYPHEPVEVGTARLESA